MFIMIIVLIIIIVTIINFKIIPLEAHTFVLHGLARDDGWQRLRLCRGACRRKAGRRNPRPEAGSRSGLRACICVLKQ